MAEASVYSMKVAKVSAVIVIGLLVSGLLLFAASRSFEEKPPDNTVLEQPANEVPVEEQIEPSFFVANSYCLACHVDFEAEELVVDHMVAGVGCERCHGESERHRSDEENATPPEIMYPRAKIRPMCMICHPRADIEHIDEHAVFLAGAETIFDEVMPKGADEVCTDCHAEGHHMSVRSVRWDKATGKILEE
jgi:hypothetical protein